MKLWLARHALPIGAEGLCYGATDLSADDTETFDAASRLAANLPPGTAIRCSPLKRCVQLRVQLLLLRPELRAQADGRIAEMSFGDWEGRRWNAIDPAAMRAWTDDFEHYRPGDGESVHDFLERVAQAFDEARAGRGDMLWITHAGVIRAATLLAGGRRACATASQWPSSGPAFGQCQVLPLSNATSV